MLLSAPGWSFDLAYSHDRTDGRHMGIHQRALSHPLVTTKTCQCSQLSHWETEYCWTPKIHENTREIFWKFHPGRAPAGTDNNQRKYFFISFFKFPALSFSMYLFHVCSITSIFLIWYHRQMESDFLNSNKMYFHQSRNTWAPNFHQNFPYLTLLAQEWKALLGQNTQW